MQFQKNHPFMRVLIKCGFFLLLYPFLQMNSASAQVNTVEFGKNRVQYQKFKWQFYQTENFNTYFYQHGEPLAGRLQVPQRAAEGLARFHVGQRRFEGAAGHPDHRRDPAPSAWGASRLATICP